MNNWHVNVRERTQIMQRRKKPYENVGSPARGGGAWGARGAMAVPEASAWVLVRGVTIENDGG